MKKIYLPILLFLLASPAIAQTDVITKIAGLVRQGNAHELALLFAGNAELTLPGDDKTHTKTDAEPALSDFLSKTHPQSVSVLHKVTSSESYQYAVLLLAAGKVHYRMDITLKQVSGAMQVIEMKVGEAKGR